MKMNTEKRDDFSNMHMRYIISVVLLVLPFLYKFFAEGEMFNGFEFVYSMIFNGRLAFIALKEGIKAERMMEKHSPDLYGKIMNEKYDGFTDVFFKGSWKKWNNYEKNQKSAYYESFLEYKDYIRQLKLFFILSFVGYLICVILL